MGWQSRALACSSYNRDPVWLLLLVACDMLQGRPGRVRSVESASFPRCWAVRQARLRQHKASIARSPGRPVRTRSGSANDNLCRLPPGLFPFLVQLLKLEMSCLKLKGLTPKNGTWGTDFILYLETDILTVDLQTDRTAPKISASVSRCVMPLRLVEGRTRACAEPRSVGGPGEGVENNPRRGSWAAWA
jgi:hypothetical protein